MERILLTSLEFHVTDLIFKFNTPNLCTGDCFASYLTILDNIKLNVKNMRKLKEFLFYF